MEALDGIPMDDPELDVSPQLVSSRELFELCAVDSELFCRTWFPKTVRHPFSEMQRDWWRHLEDPREPLLNIIAPRGFSKTTTLRLFNAKRIAYGLTNTALYIGAAEPDATRSIMWLRSQIAKKDLSSGRWVLSPFARAYGLEPGRKWNETEIEIVHTLLDQPIWVLGVGATGSVRGINFEDYRPDLITVDDALTDENTATEDQQKKFAKLLTGAIKESLAPTIDAPNRKLAMLNTPHSVGDVTQTLKRNPVWTTIEYSCWAPETVDLPIDQQMSAWEAVRPTAELRAAKSGAIQSNEYSTWAAENECRLVTSEELAFRSVWLKRLKTVEPSIYCVMAIDPVPPPSAKQLQRGLSRKDFEAVGIVGRKKGDYILCDYAVHRGHEPDWTLKTVFEMYFRWRPIRVVVEGVAYQSTLKWIIEREQVRRRVFFSVDLTENDNRKKYYKIVSTLKGPAVLGKVYCLEHHVDLIAQWDMYPNVSHEDVLEMFAMGVAALSNPYIEGELTTDEVDDDIEEIGVVEMFAP